MDSALRLLLLSVSVVMIDGNPFTVTQRPSVEGLEGKSVDIPCSFAYPESHRPKTFSISWRRKQFHGEFIYNVSKGFVHPDYRGRIEFRGDPNRSKTGTIRINNLRRSDSNRYFCRVETTGDDPKMWQSLSGTTLTVRDWRPLPTSTQITSTLIPHQRRAGVSAGKWAQWVGGVVAGVLLLCLLLVVAVYLRKRKQREGQSGNVKQGGTEGAPSLSEIPPRRNDQQSDPPNQPQTFDEVQASEGIVYAALHVKENPSPKNNIEPEDRNVLYAAVRF